MVVAEPGLVVDVVVVVAAGFVVLAAVAAALAALAVSIAYRASDKSFSAYSF